MLRSDLENQLKSVLASLPLRFAILYGSSVRRGPDSARDIDVAISPRQSMSLMELAGLEVDIERAIGKPADVIDVDEASTLLRWEIVRDGVVVAASDETALRAFQARVPLEYADLRPYLDREAAGLRAALGVR